MNTEIQDARLHHYLRNVIRSLSPAEQIRLKNIKLCGTRAIIQPGAVPAVFLLRNNRDEARFFGQVTCKNTWCCPHCSAVRMQKYGKEIAAAIDYMETQNHHGFMFTFTIPHYRFQSCREVTDMLYQTWQLAFANCFAKRKNPDGSIRWNNAFNKFMVENEIKHYVRVAEYTWGENGWHPHFHCIFWTHKKHWNKILDYEPELLHRWQEAFKTVLANHNKKRRNPYDEKTIAHFHRQLQAANDIGKPAIYISRYKENYPLIVRSSDYIAGWGAEKELTGNKRKEASHSDHYTPYQILNEAANGNIDMRELYIEFMLQVTRKPVHHRVNFSKTGIKQLAAKYAQTVQSQEFSKKKSAEWEVVAWFPSEQWQHLCQLDTESPILSNILFLASINRRDLLNEFLQAFGVKLVKSAHFHAKHIENIFNNVA